MEKELQWDLSNMTTSESGLKCKVVSKGVPLYIYETIWAQSDPSFLKYPKFYPH